MNITAIRLREERKRLSMSQASVAEKLSITRPAYVKYETGASTPQLKTIMALAEIYMVSTDYLLGKTDDRSPKTEDQPALSSEDHVKAWLRKLAQRAGNQRAMDAIDRMTITAQGDFHLEDGDPSENAALNSQLRSLLHALEDSQTNADGTKTAVWHPNK